MGSIKNHRVLVTEHGGPEVLQLVEEELPEPGAGEVRVQVLAAGISAFDSTTPAIVVSDHNRSSPPATRR